ncbi:MAG: TonB-dependent receptor [Pseudomonadota bacterium]|nr:TonB-dependent receptor [Pseudomonadota bacterium]
MKHLTIYVGVATAAMGTIAFADEAETPTLEPVKVWATEVRASSVDMDEEAIAIKQADHISDLLRPIPGVDVGGSHSLNQRITIRSMDDKDLRIYIDGANQNTYMYHHMGNLQINANILKSVDIEVGNNSVVNGGLGGTVRFETKEAKELLKPGQEVGAFGQYTYNDNASQSTVLAAYAQLNDQFDVLAYYNLINRDNFEVGGGKIKDADGNEIPGTDGTVRGLEGDLDDALLKFGWDISAVQRLSLSYEAYTDEGDYSYRPDMGLATDISIAEGTNSPLTYPTEFTRDTLTLNHDIELGDHTWIKTALYQSTSEFWRDETGLSQALQPFLRAAAGIKEATAENTGLNLLAVSQANPYVELTYGIDAVRYETEYKEDMVSGSSLKAGEEAVDGAAFLQSRIEVGGGVSLIQGIRYAYYDIDSNVVDDSYDDVLGALAAELQLENRWLFRLSATQLFKGPELGEAYDKAGYNDEANSSIEAETGLNNEFSLGFQDRILNLDRFHAGFTLFQTKIDDYIYDYAETATFYGKDNVGDMTIDGYEAYAGIEVGGLSMLLTYASAESELDANGEYSDLDGARIDREQGDSVSLLFDYLVASIDLSLHWDVEWVDDLDDDIDLDGAGNDRYKEGYTVHNISARWTPAAVEGLALTVGVDNLFDEYYASQSSRTGVTGHPVFGDLFLLDYEPGRNVKATIAYQF